MNRLRTYLMSFALLIAFWAFFWQVAILHHHDSGHEEDHVQHVCFLCETQSSIQSFNFHNNQIDFSGLFVCYTLVLLSLYFLSRKYLIQISTRAPPYNK